MTGAAEEESRGAVSKENVVSEWRAVDKRLYLVFVFQPGGTAFLFVSRFSIDGGFGETLWSDVRYPSDLSKLKELAREGWIWLVDNNWP